MDILAEESFDSTMVMMGLKRPDNQFYEYYHDLKEKTSSIKNKLYLLAAEDIEFKDVLN